MCPRTTLECALLGIIDYATRVTYVMWGACICFACFSLGWENPHLLGQAFLVSGKSAAVMLLYTC